VNNQELEKKVKEIVNAIVYQKGFVCSVDVLIKLNYLTEKDYENWRFGRVAYLEKVCKTNLKKLSTINKAIKKTAEELNLKESWTGYNQYGKGVKCRLIFSKSGNKEIEKAYTTHYINLSKLNRK